MIIIDKVTKGMNDHHRPTLRTRFFLLHSNRPHFVGGTFIPTGLDLEGKINSDKGLILI